MFRLDPLFRLHFVSFTLFRLRLASGIGDGVDSAQGIIGAADVVGAIEGYLPTEGGAATDAAA